MSQQNKWLVGPPSKRPSRVVPTAPKPVSDKAVQRLLRANQRDLLGKPLASSLQTSPPHRAQGKALIGGAICLAGGVAAAIGGLALRSWSVLALGGALLASGAWLLWPRASSSTPTAPPIVNPADAHQLDHYLADIAPRLPEAALQPLTHLKESLARLLPLLTDEARLASLPMDERFFMGQLVSRYLPDACQHYLALLDTAGDNLPADSPAEQSFLNQLDLLQARLDKCLQLVLQDQTERLSNHEAFLRSKQ
ncbi:hypothetical protein [Parachitinimonas caeni]|uniref:5-bromo-4-chloroindolyl phosphate hydrolysis protein n=1 Tax=Parachitinimonas caeni TaxID=3031301 RepID=A0ABT7DXW8_9NEIS|nr:hypothetical protein [Parachitinimonas caeni]MDK2124908.1 hypothetical protein [Parachitinimonas caeni]